MKKNAASEQATNQQTHTDSQDFVINKIQGSSPTQMLNKRNKKMSCNQNKKQKHRKITENTRSSEGPGREAQNPQIMTPKTDFQQIQK